jgi:hypothetical protein
VSTSRRSIALPTARRSAARSVGKLTKSAARPANRRRASGRSPADPTMIHDALGCVLAKRSAKWSSTAELRLGSAAHESR